jgi:hypothetical protein
MWKCGDREARVNWRDIHETNVTCIVKPVHMASFEASPASGVF